MKKTIVTNAFVFLAAILAAENTPAAR